MLKIFTGASWDSCSTSLSIGPPLQVNNSLNNCFNPQKIWQELMVPHSNWYRSGQRLKSLDAAYSSVPQGHVRQTNLVQVVFQKCNTPRTKRIWAVAVVGSKKIEDKRQTIDIYQQDYLPTRTPPFIPLATIPIPICIPDSELLANIQWCHEYARYCTICIWDYLLSPTLVLNMTL